MIERECLCGGEDLAASCDGEKDAQVIPIHAWPLIFAQWICKLSCFFAEINRQDGGK
nr:hypothetical protein [Marinicella sp. W31]MDC2877981.1 hypothetical protein [Marinicella sp. W31]